ncbi:MAG: hypothetical protein U1E87_07985 [Alphaproteobacteria bacterium]
MSKGPTAGVRFLFKKHKIDEIRRCGVHRQEQDFRKPNAGGAEEFEAKSFVIATGSEPGRSRHHDRREARRLSTGALALRVRAPPRRRRWLYRVERSSWRRLGAGR